ncbi:putative phage holin [Mycobacteroides abscessus]|uniref:putative phage holin n=1 Tax=Mycobacteroides abscessus TaxID=36809 RepID=UPI00070E151B|nr:hypothetical protein [Mycobacteroides abscessus]ALM17598.1 hypothetical protein AOY11_16340 [Mycobacteroides abscessus]AMU51712.1 hypothetical protein A3O01_17390 [Mycobacteroides abscessus]ANO10396.1 hypothetical protein BAB76_17400 [Mycobacteroides abscessus]MDM3919638.1 hypothetical protein [Mycobacteroides abscessus]MDO2963559.1 hypothetical protein [Mycobacteroides abscessus subsp. abscessus]
MSRVELLANAALCVLAVQMVGYTVTYMLGSRGWWRSGLGKTYAVKSVLLTLVLIQNAASSLSDQDYPGRNGVRLAVYIGGVLAVQALWIILRRFQRQGAVNQINTEDAGNSDD